jgi:L-fuconolactonase
MIIDAHHHLWQLSRGDYGWIGEGRNPALSPIERDYVLQDYVQLTDQHGIAGSVVVQAAQTIDETRWLLAQARASEGLILGVVGWIDMAQPDAPRVLADLARDPLLKSIRPMLQEIADVDWVLQPGLEPAFRALIERELAFDLLIRPPHLEAALSVLRRYPELRAIVDHCAKPDIANDMWQPWADLMRSIARDTGAYCKLSGLVTEARCNWRIDDLRRYVEHVIECFGVERVVWGSDWPVMLLNAAYDQWVDAARQLLQPLAHADRSRILSSNAIAFYRLAQ